MTEATPKRRRARKSDGTYQANNPETATNEAWEPVPVEAALPKKDAKYSVKQKVGTTTSEAGKYSKKGKVRPTFGNVYSTYN